MMSVYTMSLWGGAGGKVDVPCNCYIYATVVKGSKSSNMRKQDQIIYCKAF